ncbi:MAG: peptidoglycan DD-metalloendopeptidase family protein [Candidatus Marinimicrobia bacterium]|nr:peptidoglycan DD-metalloendopeptidase family protein [Candidatus Neomarinimicrobiota bacterium]
MQKLQHPIKNFDWQKNISQLFGVNRKLYLPNFGIDGHNGIDYRIEYGAPILSAHNGIVSKLSYETKWKTNGNGIYIMNTNGQFQTVYWHLSEIQCLIGQKIKVGDVLGLAGNTGFVKPEPTPQNPHAGTHLHFAMLGKDKKNNYKGFVDPLPFLFNDGEKLPPMVCFPRDLHFNMYGDDVSWLQSILKLELKGNIDFEPIGYFGKKTKEAVIELQKKYNINPTLGYVGPKTRRFITDKWTVY